MLPLQSSVSELPKFWAATFCPNPDFLSYERGNSQNSLLWIPLLQVKSVFLNQFNLAIRRTKGRLDFTVMLIPSKTKITFGLLKLLSAIPTRLRRFVQILAGRRQIRSESHFCASTHTKMQPNNAVAHRFWF